MNAGTRTVQARATSSTAGFTLLEVLIALIVLSLGLLGLAGLQMAALRNNQSSLQRSMAVVESYSIVDAMRVDRTNAINGLFDIALGAAPSGETFAAKELEKWRQRLLTLHGSTATGSVDCNGPDCTIIVQWNDERGSGGVAQQQVITQVQL